MKSYEQDEDGILIEKNELLLTVLKSAIVFLIFWNSAYFQLIPILLFNITDKMLKTIPELSILLSMFSTCVVTLIVLLVYKKELIREFNLFKKKALINMDIGFKCWFIGFLIMIIANLILAYVFKAGGAKNENLVQQYIKTYPFIMAMEVSLLAPFTEEIVFRKTLKDIINNKWILVITSALLFGGAHVITNARNILDWAYIIPYGALGGAFAYAYYKTDTVFTSIILHMLHNTLLFAISVLII